MTKEKKLDQFYTRSDIAKMFVSIINIMKPLSEFDMVIEPSAGTGNILKYLPEDAIGFDLEPKSGWYNDRLILKQDFFKYKSPYDPLHYNIDIACIGNPPFGKGYMNPLAKRFFNYAATFSNMIAFIVPAKWHSSYKVQKQLDDDFGLYYSELLPKKSFIFMDKLYNVKCCMQVWSKYPLKNYKNLRIVKKPPTTHKDFDMFLTCDGVPKRDEVLEQLKQKKYWKFGLKYWGKIGLCELKDIPLNTTTHFLIAPKKKYVRKILEQIVWSKYVHNMGAPNIGGKSILVKAYEEMKQEMKIQ